MRKTDKNSEGPPIPAIDHPELRAAISALTRSARVMRSLVLKAASQGRPIAEIVREHEDVARLADAVIDVWSERLGVSDDDDERFVN